MINEIREFEVTLDDINFFELVELSASPIRENLIGTTLKYLDFKAKSESIDQFKKRKNIEDLDLFLKHQDNCNRYVLFHGEIYFLRPTDYITPKDDLAAFKYYSYFVNLKIRQTNSIDLFYFLNYQMERYHSDIKEAFIERINDLYKGNNIKFYYFPKTKRTLKRWLDKQSAKLNTGSRVESYYFKWQILPKYKVDAEKYLFSKLSAKSKLACLTPQISITDFSKIFTSRKHDQIEYRITWTESLGLLRYLLMNLNDKKLIKVRHNDIWIVASTLFTSEALGDFTNIQVGKANLKNCSSSKKTQIDSIISHLVSKYPD